jgi:uncharacterized membrane protein YedE/YeeE
MTEYWPWWAGAIGLGAITVAFWWMLRRPLGVSGSWQTVVHWREARRLAQAELAMRREPALAGDALMAATIAQFGAAATYGTIGHAPEASANSKHRFRRRIPWTAHAVFLLALATGGLISAFVNGGFAFHWNMGPGHELLFGGGFSSYVALLLGGLAVGFGTQMAGGCTSGHGLSGCARFVPASLLATAVFFGSAVGFSFLMEALVR